jgi:hypothetical protein
MLISMQSLKISFFLISAILKDILPTLYSVFQISGPLLDESQVRSIVDEIKQVITASSTRKRERSERSKAEDFDAEEGELIKEENEQEEEVFDQVSFSYAIHWRQAHQ